MLGFTMEYSKMRPKNFTIYLAAVAILVLAPSDGFACSCPYVWESLADELNWKIKGADAIFSGEVLSVTEETRYLSVDFSVVDVWKGDVTEKVTVVTGRNGGSCGVDFKSGEKYLVFASNSMWLTEGVNNLTAGLCSRTGPLEEAKIDIDFLGEPKKTFKKSETPAKVIRPRAVGDTVLDVKERFPLSDIEEFFGLQKAQTRFLCH